MFRTSPPKILFRRSNPIFGSFVMLLFGKCFHFCEPINTNKICTKFYCSIHRESISVLFVIKIAHKSYFWIYFFLFFVCVYTKPKIFFQSITNTRILVKSQHQTNKQKNFERHLLLALKKHWPVNRPIGRQTNANWPNQ